MEVARKVARVPVNGIRRKNNPFLRVKKNMRKIKRIVMQLLSENPPGFLNAVSMVVIGILFIAIGVIDVVICVLKEIFAAVQRFFVERRMALFLHNRKIWMLRKKANLHNKIERELETVIASSVLIVVGVVLVFLMGCGEGLLFLILGANFLLSEDEDEYDL